MDNRKKLNIAMVCDPISDYKSGVLVSTLRFAERLRNRGHNIIFIGARSPMNPKDDTLNGFKVYRFPSLLIPKSEGRWYLSFPSKEKIKKILQEEKIDILHTLLQMPSSIVSMKAAKALGIKIISHAHSQPENIFMHMPKYLGRDFLSRIYLKYLLWSHKQAHAVAYPSEFAKKIFANISGGANHVVISNGVDSNEFKKVDTGNFFDKFNLQKGNPPSPRLRRARKVFYVGRLHPEKCVDTMIKSVPHVIKKQPDAHFFIAGFGHQENELKQLATKMDLSKNLTFMGKISEEDKVKAYNACDIFVSPSMAELEGMTTLEAMACGKPIIIANAENSAATYFVDKNGFLFEPENEKDLASKIISALSDKNLLDKMGEASFQKSKQYDINESVSKLENLYYSVLNV
ncbi:MAG: glycosyltransferase [Patescibacteria group bacterium]